MKQLELEIEEAYLADSIHLGDLKSPNPMVRIHGPGPDGKKCRDCEHMIGLQYAKVYWKCSLRGDLTHGAKTDQRRLWDACGKFKEDEE